MVNVAKFNHVVELDNVTMADITKFADKKAVQAEEDMREHSIMQNIFTPVLACFFVCIVCCRQRVSCFRMCVISDGNQSHYVRAFSLVDAR